MLFLPSRISLGQNRPRLAEPEIELPEQALTLTHTQLHSIRLIDPGRERLAIPKIHMHARVARLAPQHPIDFLDLLVIQSTGAARSFAFRQANQSVLVEAVHPILNRTRRIAKQASNLGTRQALRDQQHTV